LVTLTGSGGAGKTRFALQVAAAAVEGYPEGVCLSELAPVADPALVPKAVATALNVHEVPNRSLAETLVDVLRTKSLLLVLDNCEHLVAACAELADILLRSCPSLRILATSREPLGIAGEILWRVPSLSVPDPMRLPPPERLVEYEAVRLFVERATNSRPGFAVSGGNATAIAQVCSHLDGIPLAIELAAARVKVLTVEQIAARLDDRFRLLTGGGRTALPHHQTLRATMDWSYGLLSAQEQIVLRRLSVFAGGWPLEAAETVCSGNTVAAADILDVLTQLVDKSLVATETQDGEARYRLLETVRQYGRDRLDEVGEAADVRRRHRDWYLALVEQAAPELLGLGMEREAHMYLERLDIEHNNLRGALEWSRTEPAGEAAELRLAGALWRFWFERGHWSEGRAWLERSLERAEDVQTVAQLNALRGAAWIAWHQRDHERAAALGEKGLTLSRALANKEGIAWSLHILGLSAWAKADYARATALFEDSLALGREMGDKGWVSTELSQLGLLARARGDEDRAAALCGEALTRAREVGERRLIAYSLRIASVLAIDRGDHARAAQSYSESLVLLREMRDRGFVTLDCLEGLATVAYHQASFERAASLFGAADAFRESLHRPRGSSQGKYEQRLASARAGLGGSAFAAAWAAGRAMTLEQAIDYALAVN
jgi:predicted ATPase